MVDTKTQQILDAFGLSEEDLNALMESGVFKERNQLAQQQMGMADQLRGTPMPEGQMVSGRYVAANPLQGAASLIARIRGSHQMNDLVGQRKTMIDMLRKGRGVGSLAAAGEQLGMPDPRAYDYSAYGG